MNKPVMSKVKDFIDDFKSSNAGALECVFTSGYCYWFAFILNNLFGGDIMYHGISNHFATRISGRLYDITGEISSGGFMKWKDYKELDPLETSRICRDCIRKERVYREA